MRKAYKPTKTRLQSKVSLTGINVVKGRVRKDGSRSPTKYYHRATKTPLAIKDQFGNHVRWLDPFDKDDAKKISDILAELTGTTLNLSPGFVSTGSLGWLFDEWLEHPETRLKPNGDPVAERTLDRHRSTVRNMPPPWLRNMVHQFSVSELMVYRDDCIHEGRADKFNRELELLRRVFRWSEAQLIRRDSLVAQHYPPGLFTATLPITQAPHRVKHFEPWPVEMLECWFAHADPCLTHVVRFLAATSLRISDAVRVTQQQADDGLIVIEQKKTKGIVAIPVLSIPYVRAALAVIPRVEDGPLLRTNTGIPWSLSNLWHKFQDERAKMQARFPNYQWRNHSLHSLRCNGVIALLESGVDESQVRAISGHTTVEMVRQYGRDFIAKQAGLQAAMLAVNEPSIGKTLSK
jgi:integrase